ncbi:DNA-binding protein [Violaceomyces palustris]|uniref:DNA-binding protein n=1 Tax=Violaceomyces palustris TaxID=1673888 RepID=A0ACD0P1L7_9BASI|nr:DNA-binding protein [Violaceomyces palustris]
MKPPPQDPPNSSPLTYNETLESISQFLEVCLHTLLCLRQVYPLEVFTRRKKYDHLVYQSRHPGLNQYISRIVKAVLAEVSKSTVQKVILLIKPETLSIGTETDISGNGSGSNSSSWRSDLFEDGCYERYVFELDYILPEVDRRDRDLSIRGNLDKFHLDLLFRNFLQRIFALECLLDPLPVSILDGDRDGDGGGGVEKGGLTFSVVLEMKEGKVPDCSQDVRADSSQGDWVPAADGTLRTDGVVGGKDASRAGHVSSSSSSSSHNVSDRIPPSAVKGEGTTRPPWIRPIKALDTGVINLFLYVEDHLENKRKKWRSSNSEHTNRTSGHPKVVNLGSSKGKGKEKSTEVKAGGRKAAIEPSKVDGKLENHRLTTITTSSTTDTSSSSSPLPLPSWKNKVRFANKPLPSSGTTRQEENQLDPRGDPSGFMEEDLDRPLPLSNRRGGTNPRRIKRAKLAGAGGAGGGSDSGIESHDDSESDTGSDSVRAGFEDHSQVY